MSQERAELLRMKLAEYDSLAEEIQNLERLRQLVTLGAEIGDLECFLSMNVPASIRDRLAQLMLTKVIGEELEKLRQKSSKFEF